MTGRRSFLLPVVLAGSVAAHAVAWIVVRGERPEAARRPSSMVEMTVASPARPSPPTPPSPSPEPAEPPSAAARSARPASPPPRQAATRPHAPPDVAPAAAPVDFTGTTLTNDSGDAWAAAVGNGETMSGPLVAPGASRAPATRVAPAPTAGGGDGRPVVALGDLSRPPRAPDLNDELAHNYPPEARQRGITGKAVVNARVGADGKARVLGVVSETFDGFGDACRRTLEGSHWEPPRDRAGRSVDTVLTYTCRFEVGS